MSSKRVILTILALSVLSGCALFATIRDRVEAMSPVEKALWMMETYNAAAREYVREVSANPTDPDLVAALALEKEALLVAYPIILAYVDAVNVDANSLDVARLEAAAIAAAFAIITD